MKTLRAAFCFLLLFLLSTAAMHASDPTSSPPKQPPSRGMTKAQVLARYGEPFHRGRDAANEQWIYHLKFNEVYGRAFVPFEFDGDNVTIGVITFDPRGRIARFDWNRGRPE